MNNKHVYDYQVDLTSDNAANYIVKFVGNDKNVLDIGAGPGAITRLLKNTNRCKVSVIEIDESAIPMLSEYCDDIYQYDLNSQEWSSLINKKFDVVVAADVLEHLYNPALTLTSIKKVLREGGYLVISLPHIAHKAALASVLQEKFEYQESGLLDKTHIRFFGIHDMQKLLNESGYKIIDAQFVVRNPYETEFSGAWETLPNYLKRNLNKQKWGSVYQVVIKAKCTGDDANITLENILIPKAKSDSVTFEKKKGLYFKNNKERFIYKIRNSKSDFELYFLKNTLTKPFILMLRKGFVFLKKRFRRG